ncbi:MAG: hypothetical protein IT242_04485 [Bacteroidia bacterium]|nr:hypothetical protein [Bacteroidia bacterium]
MRIIPIILVLWLASVKTFCQCVAVGPSAGNTFSNNPVVGSLAWINLSNLRLQDNNYASVVQFLSSNSIVNSNYIMAQNFNFSIPAEASVCGIKVDISHRAAGIFIGASVTDNSLMLVRSGNMEGIDHASPGAWPAWKTTASYGGSSDTWGTSLTPADINSSSFGVALSTRLTTGLFSLVLTAHVDQIRVTVYFNDPLPVKLEGFTAIPRHQTVELKWSTASEINCGYFTVERSKDTTEWTEVCREPGAGTSTMQHYYSCMDYNPADVAYYRLRQVDTDGLEQILGMKYVRTLMEPTRELLLSPNPSDRYFNFSFSGDVKAVYMTTLTGIRKEMPFELIDRDQYWVNVSELPSGQYLMTLVTPNDEFHARCLIRH